MLKKSAESTPQSVQMLMIRQFYRASRMLRQHESELSPRAFAGVMKCVEARAKDCQEPVDLSYLSGMGWQG